MPVNVKVIYLPCLTETYATQVGRPYVRSVVPYCERPVELQDADRENVRGETWDDPLGWILKAFSAARIEPPTSHPPTWSKGSRRGNALTDLETYEHALKLYDALIDKGHRDLAQDLAEMHFHKGLVQEYLSDLPGAVESYTRAVAGLRGHAELSSQLRSELPH